MIKFENLSKKFGDKLAVDNINLEVRPGEIMGFLGPNGAGKTTTVKLSTGMLIPTSGKAMVAGFDISKEPIEVKKRIGYVPETGALFESLSAWEYLELMTELHHMDRSLAQRKIDEFLTIFGLADEKDHHLSSFSKGMKQKVLLAAAFLHNPEVLFLDEPLNGLDANTALIIKELLKKMAAQGKTIMFCSHILEVVERICTRIAIIDSGRIVADGSPAEILRETSKPTLEEAFAKLTGGHDIAASTDEILQALERV
ncbi:ABC transporter ATP-binding protein [candidate division KSB1 bacterium]|nr:ABC transporter ATP-binding protein [candidate division KSB1 bacterium]